MIPMFFSLTRLVCGLAGFLLVLALPALPALAQVGGIPAFNVSEGDGGSTYSLSLQILAAEAADAHTGSLVLEDERGGHALFSLLKKFRARRGSCRV